MIKVIKTLISKVRYINRVILDIEAKENSIFSLIENLDAKINKIDKDVNDIAKIIDKEKEKVDKLYRDNLINTSYVNFEYVMIPDSEKTRILLAGFYGAVNFGDELMLQKVYHDLATDNIYVLMCDNFGLNVFDYPGVNIIHYPKTKFDYNFLADKFDILVFGGGAVIDDHEYHSDEGFKYDMGKIFIELSMSFIAKNKKVYSLGLSTNKILKDKEFLLKLRYVVEKSCYFSVRDKYSSAELNRVLGRQVNLINDIVMTYNVPKKDELAVSNRTIVSIIWIAQEKQKTTLINLINTLETSYGKTDLEIRFIPFYNYCNSDIVFYHEIKEKCSSSNINICRMPKNFDDIICAISGSVLVISMRYHGALLGLMNGYKTIGVLLGSHRHYYNKMNGLFEQYNCLDHLFLSEDELLKAITEHREFNVSEKTPAFDNSEYYRIVHEISTFCISG